MLYIIYNNTSKKKKEEEEEIFLIPSQIAFHAGGYRRDTPIESDVFQAFEALDNAIETAFFSTNGGIVN
jgi:hypothetical protein